MNRQFRRKSKQPTVVEPSVEPSVEPETPAAAVLIAEPRASLSSLTWIRGLEALLLLIALLCLTSYGWAVVRRAVYQRSAPSPANAQVVETNQPAAILAGTVIEVPRLRVISRVLEDATDEHLDLGAAHVSGTAIPGDAHGNIVIAGHRDHIFWPLQHIKQGDEIRLRTPGHAYSYVVSGMHVVDPDNLEPLDQSGTPRLTLLTCYPFHFVGHAPQRYVIEADPRNR